MFIPDHEDKLLMVILYLLPAFFHPLYLSKSSPHPFNLNSLYVCIFGVAFAAFYFYMQYV